MIGSSDFPTKRMPLSHGTGHMPVLGFGALIPAAATISATRDALEAGFRHFDCAERYRNELEVDEALQSGFAAGGIAREDIFVTTKLWNTNHRPERVEPAFEASLNRLGLDYLDLYLSHTSFAFQLGDENGIVFFGFCTIGSRNKGRGHSKIQSSRQLPHELARRRHRCYWLGRYSVARLCLPGPEPRLARGRISIFPLSRKTRLMKSIEFKLDRDAMT